MNADVPASAAEEFALIDRVLDGDEAAFRALYRTHARGLFQTALRLAGGRDATAEDVVQEAWRRALHLLPQFERRGAFRSWLSAIVVRCSLERIRWDRRAGESLPDGDCVPGTRPDRPLERVDIERAFAALPAGYRAVLVLHDVEGYTHAEIASLLGIDAGTSKSQLSRARAWLRRVLGMNYTSE